MHFIRSHLSRATCIHLCTFLCITDPFTSSQIISSVLFRICELICSPPSSIWVRSVRQVGCIESGMRCLQRSHSLQKRLWMTIPRRIFGRPPPVQILCNSSWNSDRQHQWIPVVDLWYHYDPFLMDEWSILYCNDTFGNFTINCIKLIKKERKTKILNQRNKFRGGVIAMFRHLIISPQQKNAERGINIIIWGAGCWKDTAQFWCSKIPISNWLF